MSAPVYVIAIDPKEMTSEVMKTCAMWIAKARRSGRPAVHSGCAWRECFSPFSILLFSGWQTGTTG